VWQSQFVRHLLGLIELFMDGRIGRTATHGEIVARNHDGSPVDAATTEQQVRGREAGQSPVRRIGPCTRDAADLAEATRIEQPCNSFAHSQLALAMLDPDLVRSAHGLGRSLPFTQLGEFALPACVSHRKSSSGLETEQRLTLFDRVACSPEQLLYTAIGGRFRCNFHLHDLDHHDRLVSADTLALDHGDVRDHTGDRGLHYLHWHLFRPLRNFPARTIHEVDLIFMG
jgi:hypothetical protein